MEKYLIDEALIVESVVSEEINEATGKKEKNYYIEGIFSTPNKKNRNGRIYPLNLWEREVAKYQEEIKNNTINTLGEWEHPSRTSVDPIQAVIKIIGLKVEDGLVKGKAKILNDNSEKTNKLKALIDEGMKIGVSSRGTGSVRGEMVENFSLITYDAVSSPSDYNANLVGLCESLEKTVNVENSMDEANNKILDAKYQVEINQIFNSENIDHMIEIANKITDKKEKLILTTYLNLIKKVDIKPSEKVKLILENTELKELSEREKEIIQKEFKNKFSEFLGSLKSKTINETWKVTSNMAVLITLAQCKDKIEDVKIKDMLQGIMDYLSKEFNIPLK